MKKLFVPTLISGNPSETFRIGRLIGQTLKEGAIVALIGELGAGKTSLTQGIARGLGVEEDYQITSPTFTLINEYPGRLHLVHLDVYRLSGSADLPDLGYEEFFFSKSVTVIEWAEKIQDVLPENTLYIAMTYIDSDRRSIDMSGSEAQIMQIIIALKDGGF
ncbi:MAG: tRNA (adenosine(37)-N6)-threonylcarbamoyltransferase complex ATPase subunit type 1 TsaE [Syntrophus sp. (in: bacteria)]|nr:tRNA (adenosine(37)-N6)-threonylcarbamoyltransferase complex ATPase subunit type 1 TsaE [Syntrophus sp. (in: bacteria)]